MINSDNVKKILEEFTNEIRSNNFLEYLLENELDEKLDEIIEFLTLTLIEYKGTKYERRERDYDIRRKG